MSARDNGWTAGRPGVPEEPQWRRDGGPAFPDGMASGMSLRDWFAGQALAGLLATPKYDHVAWQFENYITERAYAVADAMLAARSAKP